MRTEVCQNYYQSKYCSTLYMSLCEGIFIYDHLMGHRQVELANSCPNCPP